MHSIKTTIPTPAGSDRMIEALTSGLRGWWAQDMDSADGCHTMRFVKGDRQVEMVFRVDEVADTRVRWTCTANGNPVWPGTTLTWTHIDGAIEFEHAGFGEDQSPPFQMTVDGWKHFHASLASWLETGAGQPW